MKSSAILCFVALCLISSFVSAYEINTHAVLTIKSYARSVLYSGELQKYLGIEQVADPFGDTYYDNSLSTVRSRFGKKFEATLIEELGQHPFSLEGWLMRGVIREDDISDSLGGDNPQDDPDGQIIRVRNHFYDPVNQTPLNVAGFTLGTDAPTWATGAEDAFGCPNCEDLNRRNHFTIRDARIAEWRALTGQDSNGNKNIGANGQQSDESVRKAYWATLFRSLGDVVHLVQDMAQPQHTRNEAHTPANSFSKQVYEAYTEARATGGQFICANGTPAQVIPPLNFGDYSIPKFSRYSEFFSTVTTDMNGDITTGRGLADYSNRGFFTAGANIYNTKYVFPDPSPSAYSTSQLALTSPCIPSGVNSELLNGFVSDTVVGAFNVVPMATRGLWSLPAFPGVVQGVDYSLSEDVFKAMGDLLVPRAVAYSAGLINYFFRGKLDIQLESYTRSDVTLRFKNQTEEDTVFSNQGSGKLIVTYRYEDAQGGKVFGTSDIVSIANGDDVVAQGVSQPYTFTFPSEIPVAARRLELRLVFRGRLGNETDAVAVGYKPMTSPGFLVRPNTLPADGIAGLRHIYKQDGAWKLSTETGLVVGNVDWKGSDPEDVLSFNGPQSRYFFNAGRSGYSSSIYRKGRLLASVPNSWVHGVGIRTVNNKRYLTVVSYFQFSRLLYVYSREFADAYPNNDVYDADTNPLGWKMLASFDTSSLGFTSTPFFMNASGTEAQGLMGRDGTFTYRYETRIKLNINGDSVTRTDFDNTGSYFINTDSSRNFSSSITANPGSVSGGEGLSCPSIGTECMAYCDQNGTPICGHQQHNVRSISTERIRTTSSNARGQPKIIAVDYVGDEEVFSTLEYSGVRDTLEEDVNYNENYLFDSTSLCFGVSNTQTRTTVVTETRKLSRNGGIRARLAEISIPIGWRANQYESNASDTYTRNLLIEGGVQLINEQQRVYSFSGSGVSTNSNGSLVYLDMRDNNAVYTQLDSATVYSDNNAGGTDVRVGSPVTRRNYFMYSNVTGELASIQSWAGGASTDNTTSTINIDPVGPCIDPFVENDSTSREINFGRSLAWNYMHGEAVKGLDTWTLQGYARDSNGNLFASQTLWEEQFPPPAGLSGPQPVGKWNFLTDGDPVTLFGLTGPDPHFTRVGLY